MKNNLLWILYFLYLQNYNSDANILETLETLTYQKYANYKKISAKFRRVRLIGS